MRVIIYYLAILALSACSSGSGPRGGNVSGPIASACLDGGRSGANRGLCSCIQQAANQSLSNADQARAVRFFDDPQSAQDVRQSDNPRDKAFWQRYKAFSTTAEAMCRA